MCKTTFFKEKNSSENQSESAGYIRNYKKSVCNTKKSLSSYHETKCGSINIMSLEFKDAVLKYGR